MRRLSLTLILLIALVVFIAVPLTFAKPVFQEETTIQAIGTANLRSGPGQDFALVGEIAAGTDYRVIQQHALVPWLLVEVAGSERGSGWVFGELVRVTSGSLATVPYTESFSEIPASGLPSITTAPQVETTITTEESAPAVTTRDERAATFTPTVAGEVTPTLNLLNTAAPASDVVTARLLGRSNIRYAPGGEYPIIATLDEGAVMTVLARHELLPWYKVAIETSPNGEGWVFNEVVEVQGNVNTLPLIRETSFSFPTPSATPDAVVVESPPFASLGSDSPNLAASLGDTLYNYLLSQGLAPRTDREASVFVMDLQSYEHFTINGGVAYSGMSINKIPVLVSYFVGRDLALETRDAELVANTMICSENTATNQMMTEIGAGDILEGARRVSDNMAALGLGNTYVVAPFYTGNPDATPAPVNPLQTNADQSRTQPDLFNQLTVEEIGWLLGSIYSCAAEGVGPLIETFPNRITQHECQQMIRVMRGNRIGALLEAGVAPGTSVAHKHGWIENTHGDAGIIFGPENAYVLSIIYHERSDWLDFERSFPVIEEAARQVWNYFNPTYALSQTFDNEVPAQCNIYGEPTISDMLTGNIALPTQVAPSQAPPIQLEPSPSPTRLTLPATPSN